MEEEVGASLAHQAYAVTDHCILQGSPKKGHHRTGSEPPRQAKALLLATSPPPTSPIQRQGLQDIPEHNMLDSALFPRETRGASVRFPDQSKDQQAVISRVLESPSSSPTSTPRAMESPNSTPRQGDSVIEHHVSDDNVLSNMLTTLPPAKQVPKERIAVPRLSLPTSSDHTVAPKPQVSPEVQAREPSLSLKMPSPLATESASPVAVKKHPSIEMPSTPPLLGARQVYQQSETLRQQQPINQPVGNISVAAADVIPGVA
jgi:hypothetical protein